MSGVVGSVEVGVRNRTRRAILDAAIGVLSRRPGGSLAEVAEAAEVGRTTLHRYFPERGDLLAAVSADVQHRIAAAVDRARPAEGPARAALVRACRELFDLGDVLSLVFGGALAERPEWQESSCADDLLLDVVRRGHGDGSVDAALTPEWVINLLWSILYAADAHARDHGSSRHEALDLATRSLAGALGPGDPP